MKNRIVSAFVAIGAMVLCSAGPIGATSITVLNPSFEVDTPLPNSCGVGCSYNVGSATSWVLSNTDHLGVFHPDSTRFNFPLPDGDQTAYSNSGSFSQILAATLLNSTTYTLEVDVGRRLDGVAFPDYSVQLFAGATLLDSESSLIPLAGNFLTSTVTYTSLASDPLAGQALRIVLNSNDVPITPGQVNFDNVRLDATSVPEPTSLLLLGAGLAGIGIWRWKSSRS